MGQRMQACSWLHGVAYGPATVSEFELSGLEVLLELCPFGVGRLPVFLGRSDGAAGVEEGSVRADEVFVEDGGVALGRGEATVAEHFGCDVDGQAAGDHLGGEHASKVVGGGLDRLAGRVADASSFLRSSKERVDHRSADDVCPVSAMPLEQTPLYNYFDLKKWGRVEPA